MTLDFPDTNDFTILRKLYEGCVLTICTNSENTATLFFEENHLNDAGILLTQSEIFQLAEELKLVAQTMEPPNYDFEEEVF